MVLELAFTFNKLFSSIAMVPVTIGCVHTMNELCTISENIPLHEKDAMITRDTTIRPRPPATTPINLNYVDGISLTHGSMNEHQIWTLTAIVNFDDDPTDICSVCGSSKGMDYSCEVLGTWTCKSGCSSRQIWGSGQCIGNNTFYKNLMQPTSDDLEMRVCTDQYEGDEDINMSFIELYVM